MLPYFGQLQGVELQCDVGSEDSPCVCLWAEEDIVSSKINASCRKPARRADDVIWRSDSPVCNRRDEVACAPGGAWPDDRRCEPRVEELCGSPRNATLFNGKYHRNGGNVRQGRHQPENPRQPFTKCLVDISENLFANIVWPVDTAVAPNWQAELYSFLASQQLNTYQGRSQPRKNPETIKQRL